MLVTWKASGNKDRSNAAGTSCALKNSSYSINADSWDFVPMSRLAPTIRLESGVRGVIPFNLVETSGDVNVGVDRSSLKLSLLGVGVFCFLFSAEGLNSASDCFRVSSDVCWWLDLSSLLLSGQWTTFLSDTTPISAWKVASVVTVVKFGISGVLGLWGPTCCTVIPSTSRTLEGSGDISKAPNFIRFLLIAGVSPINSTLLISDFSVLTSKFSSSIF